MKERSRSPREFRLVVAAGIGLVILTGVGAYWIKANAERPQPTIEMAIGEGTLPIAHGFEANNAVAELLQSLPPDLALDVCANLSGTMAQTAHRPCDELREITAMAPAASSGLPQSAMGGTLTALAAPALPAQAAPTSTAIEAPPPQSSPTQTPLPQFHPPTAAMEANAEPSAAPPAGVAARGVQIASAQTTEEPTLVAAADDRDSEAKLMHELKEPAMPAAPTIADGAAAGWLPSARVSALETSDAADLDDGLTGEARAKLAAAAAAAKAQAQAKAKAVAAAKAKAKAKAKARARAARNDDTAPANVGRGKDRDNGASGGGESGDSDGGHQ